jgi:L-serine/L-threonine ammonia-lyase
VIVHGASWMEANALAQSMLDASSAFVHPFDNPIMWAGHATMIEEVARANIVTATHEQIQEWRAKASA